MHAILRTTAGRARLVWALLPYAVFFVLYAATFQRWVLPFEDSGREMNTALRLAQGEVLYRDVGYSYGPLSPLIDGVLLRTFGRRRVVGGSRIPVRRKCCRQAPARRGRSR